MAYSGVDYLRLLYSLGFKVVDLIPNGYLRVVFDSGIAGGTIAEASIDSPMPGKQYIVLHYIELRNDSEAVGEFYLVDADGKEMPLITDTTAGRTYVLDVDEAVGIVLASRLVLKAKTTATTSKQNTVEARYTGRVVALTL